jgi:hypothetical protein
MMSRKPQPSVHAGDDLVQPGLPQRQGEQRRAEQRSGDAPRRDPPALAFARLGPPRSSTLTPVIVCRAVRRVNLRFLKPAAAGRRL